MKKMLVALMMLGMVGTSAMAADAVLPESSLLSQDSIAEMGLEEGVTESQEWAVSQCAATQRCRSGKIIGCTASGIATRCHRGGGHVQCQAWGSNGSYSEATDYCRH